MIAGWSPGVGDPTPFAWLTVVAYLAACLTTARAAWRDAPSNAGAWLCIAICLGLLAINKQLDLQTLLTVLARAEARTDGWYDSRRLVQMLFILCLLAVSGAAMAWLLYLTRRRRRPLRVAALGMILLLLFVCVRAASFHHMDTFLGLSFLATNMSHALEIVGILTVGLAASSVRQSRDANLPRRDELGSGLIEQQSTTEPALAVISQHRNLPG